MSWKLFIDDRAFESPDRTPPDDTWTACRSSREAIFYIDEWGPPTHVSFDFDLGLTPEGDVDTVERVYKHLGENYYDADIEYTVHSKNVVGREQIVSYMESWKKSKTL